MLVVLWVISNNSNRGLLQFCLWVPWRWRTWSCFYLLFLGLLLWQLPWVFSLLHLLILPFRLFWAYVRWLPRDRPWGGRRVLSRMRICVSYHHRHSSWRRPSIYNWRVILWLWTLDLVCLWGVLVHRRFHWTWFVHDRPMYVCWIIIRCCYSGVDGDVSLLHYKDILINIIIIYSVLITSGNAVVKQSAWGGVGEFAVQDGQDVHEEGEWVE